MVNGLLDTTVLVDLLRAYPPAGDWLSKQVSLGVSPVVWLEIIEGAEDKRAQVRAIGLLQRFERVEVLTRGLRLGDPAGPSIQTQPQHQYDGLSYSFDGSPAERSYLHLQSEALRAVARGAGQKTLLT